MSISAAEEAKILALAGFGFCPGLAETFDRRLINTTLAPATGVMQMSGIFLPAGLPVTNINFITGATGVTTNTNNWAALYTGALALMAQSTTDAGSTDYALNTKFTKTLTAVQIAPYSGLYYIAWMQAATTPALLLACAGPAANIANNDTPIIAATSTGSLTTAAPNPAGALTGQIASFYAYVS